MAITRAGAREFLWRKGELSWKLDSLQKRMVQTIHDTKADEVLILSSRQLGKSYATIVFALEYAIRNPGSMVRVLSATLKQVGDIVSDNLSPIIADAPQGLITASRSTNRWIFDNGSEIRLGALERAHVDNNRGGNADIIIAEEGGFVDSDDYDYAIRSVIGPQLLRSGGKLIHVSSPSTQEADHLLHRDILPKCELTGTAFRYTIDQSPQITPELRAKAIARCGGEHTIAWRVEYLAQIVRNEESVVIPTFDKTKHVKRLTLPHHFIPQIAIDWGGVRDKTVGLLHTFDFKRNKHMWLQERYFEPNTPTDVIVRSLLEMEQTLGDYHRKPLRFADVPGQLQVDLESMHQYSIAVPTKDDWQASINTLQVEIGQGLHEIDESCTFLIKSLENGRYNKNRTDFHRNEALGHCDAIAAMGYGRRMMDTYTNPYPLFMPHRDNHHRPDQPKPDEFMVAEALQPKSFANTSESRYFVAKQFGAFKR